ADFAGLRIAHAKQSRRIRSGGLLLAHDVYDLHLMARGDQSFEGVFGVTFADQEIRNNDHGSGRPALEQQLIDGRSESRLASRFYRHHERFEVEVGLAAAME